MYNDTIYFGTFAIKTPKTSFDEIRADMLKLCDEGAEIIGDPYASQSEKDSAVERMNYAADVLAALDAEERA